MKKYYLYKCRIVSENGVVSLALCTNKRKLLEHVSGSQYEGFKVDEVQESGFYLSVYDEDIRIRVCN